MRTRLSESRLALALVFASALFGCGDQHLFRPMAGQATSPPVVATVVCSVQKLKLTDVTYVPRFDRGTYLTLTVANRTATDLVSAGAVDDACYFELKDSEGNKVEQSSNPPISHSGNFVERHGTYVVEIPLSDLFRLVMGKQYTVRVGWRYNVRYSDSEQLTGQVAWSDPISFVVGN